MASKQNEDLFGGDPKQGDGSLPLDFAGGATKKDAEPKKEIQQKQEVKSVVSEPPRKEMVQNQPAAAPAESSKTVEAPVSKPDLSTPRKPMHHVPPPYKKSVQEQASSQAQTQEVKETKPPTPPPAPAASAPVPAPAKENVPEKPKEPAAAPAKEAKAEVPAAPAASKPPETVKEAPVAAPKPVQAAVPAEPAPEKPAAHKHPHSHVPAAPVAAAVPAPVPAPVPVAAAVAAPSSKDEPAAEKKEPVKLQPKEKKEKEHKEESKPSHKVEHKAEHKVEHKVEHREEPRIEPKVEAKAEKPHVPHSTPPSSVKKELSPAQHSHAHAAPHESKAVKQEEKKEAPKFSKKSGPAEKFSSDNATSGQILQEGRVRTGLSIEQVSITTKIKKNFIEALERDDFQHLPAPVYVNAYVRSLCSLYKIDEKQVTSLLGKAKGKTLEYTVPEEVIQQIEKGKQVNLVQESKVRKFTLSLVAACLILAAGIGITYQLVVMDKVQTTQAPAPKQVKEPVISTDNAKPSVLNSSVLQEHMEKKLIAPHVFTMSQLQLPPER